MIPDRGFSIHQPLNCMSTNIVYMIECFCGKHYVGRTSNPKKRWTNHKSHIRLQQKTCNLATHCIEAHSEIMVGNDKLRENGEVKELLKFIILDTVGESGTEEDLKFLEDRWRDKLLSWAPDGLNTKDD